MNNIPPNRLKGKIAIVTASSQGIGFAIVKRLAQEGAQVILSSRNQQNVDTAVSKLASEGLNVRGIVCHALKAEHRKQLLEEADKLGGLDILVANAGANPTRSTVSKCSEELWNKMLSTNLSSAFLIAKESIPLFKKRGGGNIVLMSSVAGFHPINNYWVFPNSDSPVGVYSVCKTALFGLTKALSIELANENVRINCIAPGLIETQFTDFITESPNIHQFAVNHILLRRVGTPDEVSGVVSFLASDDARYITGEIIVVSGGMQSRM